MRQRDKLFWIWLAEALGAGSRVFRSLIDLYDSPYELFLLEESEIERIPSLTDRAARALSEKSLDRATKIMETCERSGIGIVTYGDENYPKVLRDIQSPPCVLYYRGTLPDWNSRLCIGMVGTRRMSAYGLRVAYKISYELAYAGAIVVSGMAAGIDGVCAAAAMAAGGTTVAILGCGVDVVYPKHHRPLWNSIAEQGVVLSEYPPATRPATYHFPQRNRLISGLAQGTVVIEAGIGSGSLITAKDAILQGRDVFASPANVGRKGADGTPGLLRDGARMALSTDDVLAPYQYTYAESLNLEKYEASKALESIDLSHMASLGVIELSSNASGETKMNLNPAKSTNADTKEKKSMPRRTSSAKAEKTPATVAEPKEKREEEPKILTAPPKVIPEATLATLTPIQKAILESIPDDGTLSTDAIFALEHPYADIMASLTMLEIMGLIQKLPGSLYKKA